MDEISGGRLPVLTWAPDLEEGARRQALNCANLPVAFHHVAVMADGHQGYGVPIGAVIALAGAISPYAVGNDIGCGMALVPTTLTRDDMLERLPTKSGATGPVARDDIMGWVQTSIPSGRDSHQRTAEAAPDVDPLLHEAFDAMDEAASGTGLTLSTSQTPDASRGQPLERDEVVTRGRAHAGTLGSGNHFIELLAGPDDEVWVMLHSGSRGVGGLVCNNFHRMALRHCEDEGYDLPDPGLAWLPLGEEQGRWSRAGESYRRALGASLAYAEANRRRMLEVVGGIIERRFPGAMRWDGVISIHHNDAVLERHFGRDVWVHRKGAVKAPEGGATIIPGSMGAGSYVGRGLGRPESFASCSHGAGRTMSRGAARRELQLQQQLESVTRAGGKVFATSKEAVLDEMPGAYKDLEEVMAHQVDLVAPVRRLLPLATYKGADAPRRKRPTSRRRTEDRNVRP